LETRQQKAPLREQNGDYTYSSPGTAIRRASLTREEREEMQQQASPHRAGHYAGLHPEDVPYQTGSRSTRQEVPLLTFDEDEDDDRIYRTRPNTSVRVYNLPKRPARTYSPPPTQVTEDMPQAGISFRRFVLVCFLVILVGILIAMLINLYVLPALGRWNDDRTYGYPRITKATANVGHGDKQHPDSQFIAINNNGVIDVIELSYGNQDQKTAHVYYIATLTGENANLVPVTSLTFQDENGDGKPDLEVVVNNTLYIMYNDGKEFTSRLSG
jgi:hypothetical protein